MTNASNKRLIYKQFHLAIPELVQAIKDGWEVENNYYNLKLIGNIACINLVHNGSKSEGEINTKNDDSVTGELVTEYSDDNENQTDGKDVAKTETKTTRATRTTRKTAK